MGRPAKYLEESRRQAVALVLDGKRTKASVAAELGINPETLRGWVRDAAKRTEEGPAALSDSERLELAALRRKVAELELEKEILKKAAAFFAKDTLR